MSGPRSPASASLVSRFETRTNRKGRSLAVPQGIGSAPARLAASCSVDTDRARGLVCRVASQSLRAGRDPAVVGQGIPDVSSASPVVVPAVRIGARDPHADVSGVSVRARGARQESLRRPAEGVRRGARPRRRVVAVDAGARRRYRGDPADRVGGRHGVSACAPATGPAGPCARWTPCGAGRHLRPRQAVEGAAGRVGEHARSKHCGGNGRGWCRGVFGGAGTKGSVRSILPIIVAVELVPPARPVPNRRPRSCRRWP